MFGGMFYSCAQGNLQNTSQEGSLKPAITVAGIQLPKVLVDATVEGQISQADSMTQFGQPPKTPIEKAQLYGEAVNGMVDQGAYAYLAQQMGADLSDNGIVNIVTKALDEDVTARREQAVQMKQLKANASEKEWDEAFKKQMGKTPAEYKKSTLDEIQKGLAEPAKRQDLVMRISPTAVAQLLSAKYKLSDEDLRKGFEAVTYKRIQLKSEVPGKSAQERADAALKAIKDGLKFETAIDRYSNELPTPGKKLNESTFSATGTDIDSDPQFTPLGPLKVGEVSGAVDYSEGKVIYKVVSRKPTLPTDFENQKETYRRQAVMKRVQAEVVKELDAVKDKPGNVVFDAPGYKVAYDYIRLTGGTNGGKVIDPAKAKAVFEEATAVAEKNSDTTAQAAAYVQYAMLGYVQADPASTPDQLVKREIKASQTLLGFTFNFTVRMKLIDLLVKDKQNDEASRQLLQAARDIASFDANAMMQFQEVSNKRLELVSKKVLDPAVDKDLVAYQRRWITEKAESDKIEAEKRKQQEAEAKKLADEAKKAEEAKKKNAPATPTTTGTATTGTTPAPATTTTGR